MARYTDIPQDLMEGWTILAIDDHEAALEIIEDILSFYGAEVVTAGNGEDGYNLAVKTQPRFIISDIDMPILDGWGLIEKLKADLATRDIPVIALTAHAMVEDRERAISKGFHNYLSKPLDPFTFLTQILILLEDVEDIANEIHEKIVPEGQE